MCSSTEMGAPGASHLGTGDHGPKTDRSRARSVPVNALVAILSAAPPDFRLKPRVQSLSSETYAAEWISSLRNGMLKNCVFGTYRAPATELAGKG